jgi:hypothetical protein
MSVGSQGPYDFVLQDTEQNPRITLGFILTDDEVKSWVEGRVAPLPPRRSEGELNWTHKDPISDFVFAQNDWSGGAFRPYYTSEGLDTYAKSDGVDMRWEGVAALGGRRGALRASGSTIKSKIASNYAITNGDWEEGQVVGWAAGAAASALTVSTSAPHKGLYEGQIDVAQSTVAGIAATQSTAQPTVFRSREVTVIAYIRRSAGSDAGLFLRLADGVGNTDSTAVTSSTYTYVSVTRTIDSSASEFTVSFRTNATTSTDIHTFFIDSCYVVPTGGVECTGKAIITSTDPDEIYIAVGRTIAKWSETTFTWEIVYLNDSATITDFIEYNDVIYAAFGEANGATPHQYVYGSGTSWTTAALNATATHHENHARFWVKARNGYNTWVLWKAGPSTDQGTERNAIAWSQTPSVAWEPTSYFICGTADRHITGIYPFRDTFIVCKVDGIWIWDGIINDFVVITPEWEHSMDEANGANGQLWHNDLYLSTIRQGFFRYALDNLEDLSPLLMSPRLVDFGGQITAMTACARELILGLDQPTADTVTTKTSRLVRLRLSSQNEWEIHTTQEPDIGIIDCLTLHRDTRLWAIGRTYDSNLSNYICTMNAFIEPSKIAAPYADVTPSIEWNGYFDTSIWNGGMPETDKAFIAVTIWCKNLDSNHTIQVSYGRDGLAPNTQLLGVFNGTNRVQTLLFKDVINPIVNAVGRFVQLRFTFTTNDTVSPLLFAFAMHTQLVPKPIRIFDLGALVGGGTLLRGGQSHELTKSDIASVFRELEVQVFPLTMIDDFGQTHDGAGNEGEHTRQVRLVNFSRTPLDDYEQGQEQWNLTLQEVSIT